MKKGEASGVGTHFDRTLIYPTFCHLVNKAEEIL